MEIPNNLSIVPPAVIPHGGTCPLDNLGKLYKLALLMQKICDEEEGIGLSAVQVGIPFNFFVVKFDSNYRYFLNCEYTALSEKKTTSVEGCLSLKTPQNKLRHFVVRRFEKIVVKGKELLADPNLSVIDIELFPEDYYKDVFQHEIDHQLQILISDIGQEIFLYKS